MGNILEPSVISPTKSCENKDALLRENYLSEFGTEDDKAVVRENLGVYAKDFTYNRDEAQAMVQEKIKASLQDYVTNDKLPKAIEALSTEIAEASYVKSDGTVPFLNPQSQSSLPTLDSHLTNKVYVDNLLKSHINSNDPHQTLDKVKLLLNDYAKLSDIHTTANLYSKKEIDALLCNFVKKDGSVPFLKPQLGVDPSLPSHLATARYVQLVMQNHKNEADPHEFLSTLKRYLSNYYSKSEVYTKSQTYSRSQLLDIIKSQMKDIIDQRIATHIAEDGSVSELKDFVLNKLFECIKADGSVSHIKPQAGVPAEKPNEFVVLQQLSDLLDKLKQEVTQSVKDSTNQSTWVPSGPVKATVGFVEAESKMPPEMTVQQICDAIFYGRKIGVVAPEYAEYGEKVCIKIYTHGVGMLNEAEVYKNGNLIGTLTATDFANLPSTPAGSGVYYEYCETGDFTEDTNWKVVFHYSNGQTITDTATTKLSYPMFIGALPYWWNAQEDITMNSLREKVKEDPENCKFFTHLGPDIKKLKASFNFETAEKRSIVIVVPKDYPDLVKLITPTQTVTEGAFAKWLQPMYPNNATVGVVYKIYVFNQPLVKLNQTLKVSFTAENNSDDDE